MNGECALSRIVLVLHLHPGRVCWVAEKILSRGETRSGAELVVCI